MASVNELTKEEFERIQAEHREYVENIKIEYSFGCYKENKPDSCHLLGQWFEVIEKNFEESYNLFKDNCLTRKYSQSCYKYANYRMNGIKEKPERLEELIDAFKMACDGDVASGCQTLGLIYWNAEKGRSSNPELAVKYLERACELGNAMACFRLSNWFLDSEEERKKESKENKPLKFGFVQKDTEKALSFAIRACDLGYSRGCIYAALMYRGKDGFPLDKDKAADYIKKAKEIEGLANKTNLGIDFTGQ
uniref:Cytochrome c oxidase assembly factor 7 (inferred by orthology to a human protein) n=1 Tax=Strongyloides venezuelensis TaxID=75913 RepID=A0A0K0F6J5_STRVS